MSFGKPFSSRYEFSSRYDNLNQPRSPQDYNPRTSNSQLSHSSPKETLRSSLEYRFYPASPEASRQEIKNSYDRAIRTSNDNLSIQEIQKQRSLDILRSNIKDLELQDQQNEENHELEKARLKHEYELKIENLNRDLENQIRTKNSKLRDIEYTIEREQKAWEQQKREMSLQLQRLNEETDELNVKALRDNDEIRYIRSQIEGSQLEAQKLVREKSLIIEKHENEKRSAMERHGFSMKEMHIRIQEYDEKIMNLEIEIAETRKQIAKNAEESEFIINELENKIESAENTIKIQMQDISRLKNSRDEAKTECQILSNEVSMMESQIAKTHNTNSVMKDDIARLNRLIYGKGVSPRKSKQKHI
ncbi:unnamed protein product [Blepharisma stoltei]|uniref:Uncharacterized protein n=1 Tax=Blepharisma stoltei TaxID=1481888 RepID=A0AAU9ITY5_9CILI|nr:unnamed protein product [Blepharisma stoltei]